MRWIILLVSLFLIMPLAHAHNSDNMAAKKHNIHAKKLKNNTGLPGQTPPGLKKKSLPKGLSDQGKRPAGWDKGNKEGWH